MAKTGAKIFGGFDVEEASATEALTHTSLPVLLVHGDDDRFVPCSMSEECQKVGPDHIQLLKMKGAGHGLSFCVDAKTYRAAITEFCNRVMQE
jgi:pimeloyl-ACP methyl ester carboxylesterase